MMALSSHPLAPVATITIRNVPEVVHQLLKERAEKAGRSLNSELIRILVSEASKRPGKDPVQLLAEIRAFKATQPDMEPVSAEELKRWINEGRA